MKLARDLGMTRGELRAKLSHREYVDWIAFYNVEAELKRKAEKARGKGR